MNSELGFDYLCSFVNFPLDIQYSLIVMKVLQ